MNKALEAFNFILHKTYDVSELKSYVEKYTNAEWLLDESRQKETIHHTKTQTYFISYFELTDDFSGYDPQVREGVDQELVKLIMPIIKDMESVYKGKFGRILLIKLPHDADITPHFDDDPYFDITRRFHLPIVTNDLVDFYVNDEVVNMKEGQCWEINNRKTHKVVNRGINDRVHLLFDIVPGGYLESN